MKLSSYYTWLNLIVFSLQGIDIVWYFCRVLADSANHDQYVFPGAHGFSRMRELSWTSRLSEIWNLRQEPLVPLICSTWAQICKVWEIEGTLYCFLWSVNGWKKLDIEALVGDYIPCISLNCMLVPVHWREFGHGLLAWNVWCLKK